MEKYSGDKTTRTSTIQNRQTVDGVTIIVCLKCVIVSLKSKGGIQLLFLLE